MMYSKVALALGLALVFASPIAFAPDAAAQAAPDVRNPVLGDPGPVKPRTRVKQTPARAAAIAKSDKQGPGTENGNQPARAAAGGGGG